jgi:hypothetical protein
MAETCDGVAATCPPDVNKPDGTSCSDGLFCNGAETCQSGACTNGTPPCTGGQICSEGQDACLSSACPAGPSAVGSGPGQCRTAGKNLLLIKNKTDNSKDKLIWKFIKGAATTQVDLADPRTTADYALCIYAGTTNTLVATLNVPPDSSKWTTIGSKGFKFLDTTPYPDAGVQKMILKGGTAGKSKMLVKGRGTNLPDPIDSGSLPMPVTVQLFNYQTGVCFNGTFNSALKNTTTLFKAKNP